ncbi:hypothetical protein IU474_04895 [Nocardia otitidiscaviarum]|uniref:hypothetical protein n=1 Tax=Nocardia otitidiscaviarum TaxID=1823 RepID=UPI0018932A9C|nr:hypothetical protein [Nocardia otitidiscaviarum]MBF6236416.1 hypothetical protein [Nocardia otitidiscaviarum]
MRYATRTGTQCCLLAVLLPWTAACGEAGTRTAPESVCRETHNLAVAATQQTEAGGRFDDALERAGRDGQPVTMIDITRSAGWADDWDRMIEVRAGATDDVINQRAHTVEHCWEGTGRSGAGGGNASEGPPSGYYVFTRDNGAAGVEFVRAVRWYGDRLQLKMGGRDALGPETVMARVDNGYLRPNP